MRLQRFQRAPALAGGDVQLLPGHFPRVVLILLHHDRCVPLCLRQSRGSVLGGFRRPVLRHGRPTRSGGGINVVLVRNAALHLLHRIPACQGSLAGAGRDILVGFPSGQVWPARRDARRCGNSVRRRRRAMIFFTVVVLQCSRAPQWRTCMQSPLCECRIGLASPALRSFHQGSRGAVCFSVDALGFARAHAQSCRVGSSTACPLHVCLVRRISAPGPGYFL
mmetsp:Transcript_1860/g.4041  ORF Transcript_1860/g.4041 Transcript_1860/m.4041 type:complete len:222 (+) Transcript_1860:502-1167(+)